MNLLRHGQQWLLKGPSKKSKIVWASVARGALNCPRSPGVQRSVARASGPLLDEFVDGFPQARSVLDGFRRIGPTFGFSGGCPGPLTPAAFNFWRRSSLATARWTRPRRTLRLGESLWGIGLPNPPLSSSARCSHLESWKRSRPLVSSHQAHEKPRNPASPHTCLTEWSIIMLVGPLPVLWLLCTSCQGVYRHHLTARAHEQHFLSAHFTPDHTCGSRHFACLQSHFVLLHVFALTHTVSSYFLFTNYVTDATDWNQIKPLCSFVRGWTASPSGRSDPKPQVTSPSSASMSVASTLRSTFLPEKSISRWSTTLRSPASKDLNLPQHSGASSTSQHTAARQSSPIVETGFIRD